MRLRYSTKQEVENKNLGTERMLVHCSNSDCFCKTTMLGGQEMTSSMIKHIPLALSALLAFGINAIPVNAGEMVITEKRTIHLCGDLFELEANADKLTASQRAVIVQKNLDNALIKAKNRTPSAVQVSVENRHPVVKLDGYHIVTADANSAKRKNMTMMELAEMWADSIRHCLADDKAVQVYVSRMVTKEPVKSAKYLVKKHIVVLPPQMRMPIQMVSGFYFDGATLNDTVTAVINRDIPLMPDYKTYLPKGTLVHGKVIEASKYSNNQYPNNKAVTIDFFVLETPDGQEIPISGHVFGECNKLVKTNVGPLYNFPNLHPINDLVTPQLGMVEESDAEPQGMVNMFRGTSLPSKGMITGAWMGEPYSKTMQDWYTSRLLMDKGTAFIIPADQEIQMETHATTTITVAAMAGVL